jgi:hypothetical protein
MVAVWTVPSFVVPPFDEYEVHLSCNGGMMMWELIILAVLLSFVNGLVIIALILGNYLVHANIMLPSVGRRHSVGIVGCRPYYTFDKMHIEKCESVVS